MVPLDQERPQPQRHGHVGEVCVVACFLASGVIIPLQPLLPPTPRGICGLAILSFPIRDRLRYSRHSSCKGTHGRIQKNGERRVCGERDRLGHPSRTQKHRGSRQTPAGGKGTSRLVEQVHVPKPPSASSPRTFLMGTPQDPSRITLRSLHLRARSTFSLACRLYMLFVSVW